MINFKLMICRTIYNKYIFMVLAVLGILFLLGMFFPAFYYENTTGETVTISGWKIICENYYWSIIYLFLLFNPIILYVFRNRLECSLGKRKINIAFLFSSVIMISVIIFLSIEKTLFFQQKAIEITNFRFGLGMIFRIVIASVSFLSYITKIFLDWKAVF